MSIPDEAIPGSIYLYAAPTNGAPTAPRPPLYISYPEVASIVHTLPQQRPLTLVREIRQPAERTAELEFPRRLLQQHRDWDPSPANLIRNVFLRLTESGVFILFV